MNSGSRVKWCTGRPRLILLLTSFQLIALSATVLVTTSCLFKSCWVVVMAGPHCRTRPMSRGGTRVLAATLRATFARAPYNGA